MQMMSPIIMSSSKIHERKMGVCMVGGVQVHTFGFAFIDGIIPDD
jgi:hypothetical protein